MQKLVWTLLVTAILGGAGAAAYQPVVGYWKDRHRSKFRHAETARGRIVYVVNATGTIKPVLSVQIGAFVSGPVVELLVNFNDQVKKDDLLARIDPRLYEANVARDQAVLATRKAELNRAAALLQQAENEYRRVLDLQARSREYISETEMDRYKFNRISLEAELELAEAAVKQAEASLENSEANLEYTFIRAPVDGVVIERKIEPGQTLAAQFQTPELFVIAPDMEKHMHVYASVDEVEIGLIRKAQEEGRPVKFTVGAYPDDLFQGTIFQIRKSSTTTQNVVTYPVVIEAPNPELKLLPGMTANLSFEVEVREDVVKIPNAALRFYPDDRDQVHSDDQKLLDGIPATSDDGLWDEVTLPAPEKAEANRKRNRRHVWFEADGLLRAVEVTVGVSDHRFTELVSGNLREGQKLVTGVEPKS
jgi:HlyD family secretion protein